MPLNARAIGAFCVMSFANLPVNAVQISPATTAPHTLRLAPMSTGGRVLTTDFGKDIRSFSYQWPGAYFELSFESSRVYFEVVSSKQILHVLVDDEPPIALTTPAPGFYQISGLAAGKHTVRLEVVTENQDSPGNFGGFALPAPAKVLRPRKRARQIEFIGDSYTVGYGNLSNKTDCTHEEVWATTDNSLAFGPLTAKHFDADYQINAISGRGIVRNYNGSTADVLPAVYPFVQFNKKVPYENSRWRPQVIVVGLGTNDFSTQLNPGEKWTSREDLHASYEAGYVRFLQQIRARSPDAFLILMATDGVNGEIQSEVKRVLAQLEAAGERKVAFIPMNDLAMTGCDSHPSAADDQTVADLLIQFLNNHPQVWQGK